MIFLIVNNKEIVTPVTAFKIKSGVNYEKTDKNYDLFQKACKIADENKSIHPIAVTISGFIIGKLLTFSKYSFKNFLDLLRPMAVIVPKIVDINVESRATVRETITAPTISRSLIKREYHCTENPVKLLKDFDELNEKIIMTKMVR